MAKAPIAGYCKTRLIPHLGAVSAARVQLRLIQKTIETARASGIGPVSLWCTPDSGHEAFIQARRNYDVHLKRQHGADLGKRMLFAIGQSLKDCSKVIILGTDCPALTADHLRSACNKLDTTDYVFQPAEDGGYVMVGCRHYAPALFRNVPWGTTRVMHISRRRLNQGGYNYEELPVLWDVDEIADLQRARKNKLIG